MVSISYQYRIGKSTMTYVIRETCRELWQGLKDVVLLKLSRQQWMKIAIDFENRWNFPHCIGALDGKHVMIQVLPPGCFSA